MVIFKNRSAAGEILAKRLVNFTNAKGIIVLGIPRGGVVVASEIAKRLNLPLDILITRKIGAPDQKELALGAIDPSGEVVWDNNLINDLGLKIHDLREEVKEQEQEIKRREELYRQGKPKLDLSNKTVILVDDGIATGATVQAAVNYIKKLGAKRIILSVPVISSDVLGRLDHNIERKVILQRVDYLGAVGNFYEDFRAISDEEVIELLS